MIFWIWLLGGGALLWWAWEKMHRRTHAVRGGVHENITLDHEQEFELYHNSLSLCSKKVRVCLAELGIDYKSHHIDLIETGSYEVISRHYLKVNPSGVVPALVHNGHPVYESHDIIAYCAERAGPEAPQLVPKDSRARAIMQEWVSRASLEGDDAPARVKQSAANCVALLTAPLFCSGIYEIPYRKIFEGLLFHRLRIRPMLFMMLKLRGLRGFRKIRPLMTMLVSGRNYMAIHLDLLDKHLAESGSWICGEQYTLADVSWLVIFERLQEASWYEYFLGGEQRPHVDAYRQRLKARASYHAAIEEHRLPIVTRATQRLCMAKQEDSLLREALEPESARGR